MDMCELGIQFGCVRLIPFVHMGFLMYVFSHGSPIALASIFEGLLILNFFLRPRIVDNVIMSFIETIPKFASCNLMSTYLGQPVFIFIILK